MQVRLITNIGSNDARIYGLSETDCGAVVQVGETEARFLLMKGWAEKYEPRVNITSASSQGELETLIEDTEDVLEGVPETDLQAVPPKRRGRRPKNAD